MKRLFQTMALAGALTGGFALTHLAAAQTHSVTLGTCGTAGLWYQTGMVISDLVSKHVDGVSLKAIPTSCSSYNLIAIAKGEFEIGMSMSFLDPLAYSGVDPFDGRGTKGKIRGVTTYYTSYLHLFTLDPEIDSVEDLRGKRVAVGTPSGGTFQHALAVMSAAGINPETEVELKKVNLEVGLTQLKAGQVDAQFWTMSLDVPGMQELVQTRDTYFIPVPRKLYDKVPADVGASFSEIPAGAYPLVNEPVPALAAYSTFVTTEEVEDEVVMKFLEAIYGHLDDFRAALPATSDALNRENALKGMNVPLHPAARAFYEEHDFPGLEEYDQRMGTKG